MESTLQPSCNHCTFRPDRPFCAMSTDAIRSFDEIKEQSVLGKGALLFAEGRPSRGVYVLCDGRAKLSICSESGKRLMLRVAVPGEVLGLGASLSGEPYEFTAESLDTAQVVFVKRKNLLKFLRDNPAICMEVVRRLSDDLHGAYERVRSIGLNRARRAREQRARSKAS
jgi:CRP/FNR family transcriptional regulator, cyclic AMP receptor protein